MRTWLLTCLVLLANSSCDARSDHSTRPNVIVILADDLGYGDLGCYGQRNFATPRLDRMAREGMRFTQFYAGCTVCAPSRACLLTGQHTGHVYQRINGNLAFRPDPQDRCIAALLKPVGYHTAMIGKSGLSCNTDDGGQPNRKGFDHFFGYTSHSAAHRYYPEALWRNGVRETYSNNHGQSGEQYSGDLFLADTLAYLEARALDGLPFLLHVSLQQPHADLCVPDSYRDRFIGKFDEVPYSGGNYRAEQHPKATFAGMVTYLDESVGKILDKLQELGLDGHTLVIFTSDNGAMSEGGWDAKYFASSGPLRGGKRDLYEGGIRVPMIARWPGQVPAGAESEFVGASWDFVPTACDLAELPAPASLDGVSLVPTLLGKSGQELHDYLYWEFYEQGGKQAVRWGDWKGVRLRWQHDPNASIELYDLNSDNREQANLAEDHPDVVHEIAQRMRVAHSPPEFIQASATQIRRVERPASPLNKRLQTPAR